MGEQGKVVSGGGLFVLSSEELREQPGSGFKGEHAFRTVGSFLLVSAHRSLN